LMLLGFGARKMVGWATMALLVVFTLHLVWLWIVDGNDGNCGCLGGFLEMTPLVSILKNVVLMGGLYWALRNLGKHAGGKPNYLLKGGVYGACAGLLFLLFPMPKAAPVPSDPVIAELTGKEYAKYTTFSSGEVDLMKGEKLVAVFSLDCDHCKDAAKLIAKTAQSKPVPTTYCLFLGSEADVPAFFDFAGAEFPWHIPSLEDFFNHLQGAPPRISWLKDGQIVKNWEGDEFSEAAFLAEFEGSNVTD
ncbi:MAG: MauE/DoxX family redox-associated membrane protein, partial [Bacteroidota bacterium]